MSRFNQYRYALCNYFRRRGYDVNTREKTIVIDPEELYHKELVRLKKLQTYGFKVINPNRQQSIPIAEQYSYSESFVDFADEIIAKCRSGFYD